MGLGLRSWEAPGPLLLTLCLGHVFLTNLMTLSSEPSPRLEASASGWCLELSGQLTQSEPVILIPGLKVGPGLWHRIWAAVVL